MGRKHQAAESMEVFDAARKGDLEKVKECVETDGEHILLDKDKLLRIPLHLAAFEGHLDVVEYLIATDKRQINQGATGQCTALMFAAQKGHAEVCEALLKAGAKPNKTMKGQKTALHMAIQKEHIETVRVLLEYGAIPHLKTAKGDTATELAGSSGNDDLITILADTKPTKKLAKPKRDGESEDEPARKKPALAGADEPDEVDADNESAVKPDTEQDAKQESEDQTAPVASVEPPTAEAKDVEADTAE
eukprot:TRINITY_DN67311_c8_g7_i1.p1 TRINITY_DN67311_c8_g7~~TRINITY_DN67311_c8_g7_i1.p1  ORF type:complete len:248 (-),score=29.61 TRINITY_DN67311_c8_g7_i1:474-1217(-)